MTLKGKVWVHPKYTAAKQGEAAKGRSTLASFETAFKDYWTTGFHPSFGKDTIFEKPFPDVLPFSLRKAHVRPTEFTNKFGPGGTKNGWNNRTIITRDFATSNIYMAYAVNVVRDALILALIDNAHYVTESAAFMQGLMEGADYWYTKTGIPAMPVEQQHTVWMTEVWSI